MLVLSFLRDETCYLVDKTTNRHVTISLVDIRGNKCRIGINAPSMVGVYRHDLIKEVGCEFIVDPYFSKIHIPGFHNLIGQWVKGTICGTTDVVREGVVVAILGQPTEVQRLLIQSEDDDFYVLLTKPLQTDLKPPRSAEDLINRINKYPVK